MLVDILFVFEDGTELWRSLFCEADLSSMASERDFFERASIFYRWPVYNIVAPAIVKVRQNGVGRGRVLY